MKKERKEITGFITRTRRSKKACLSLSMLRNFAFFNTIFTDYIKNNKYESVDIEYTEKVVFLNFKKNSKGYYKLWPQKRDNQMCFSGASLKKYLIKDIYQGKGIAHYAIHNTGEKHSFALRVMTTDFE